MYSVPERLTPSRRTTRPWSTRRDPRTCSEASATGADSAIVADVASRITPSRAPTRLTLALVRASDPQHPGQEDRPRARGAGASVRASVRFGYTILYVRDVAASVEFYEKA